MIILKCVPHVQYAHYCRSANQIFTLDDIDAKAPYRRIFDDVIVYIFAH